MNAFFFSLLNSDQTPRVKRRCRPLARQEKVLLREQAGRRKLGDDLKFLPQHGPFQQLRLVILPAPSVDCRQPNP